MNQNSSSTSKISSSSQHNHKNDNNPSQLPPPPPVLNTESERLQRIQENFKQQKSSTSNDAIDLVWNHMSYPQMLRVLAEQLEDEEESSDEEDSTSCSSSENESAEDYDDEDSIRQKIKSSSLIPPVSSQVQRKLWGKRVTIENKVIGALVVKMTRDDDDGENDDEGEFSPIRIGVLLGIEEGNVAWVRWDRNDRDIISDKKEEEEEEEEEEDNDDDDDDDDEVIEKCKVGADGIYELHYAML